MPEFRDGKRQLLQVAFFCFPVNANDAVRLGKRQTAQKKIMHQTEDGGVHPDADGEGEDSEKGEGWRLQELSESKAEVVHEISDLKLVIAFFIRNEALPLDRAAGPNGLANSRPANQPERA